MAPAKAVLVTGATGFLGRATVPALAKAGWEVTVGSRTATQPLTARGVHLDLAEPAKLLALAKQNRFDAIVHLGARVGWRGETEAELFVPNVLATGCLAYLAGFWDARLIFASAAIVHGVRQETIETDSPLCSDTAYAKSKWLGEQLLTTSGIKQCVLRIGGVFGAGGPSHLGLNRAINSAIKGELPVQIGSGNALRNYVYVQDVAQAIVFVLQEHLGGTHLLAGSEVLSVREMLQGVCDTFFQGRHPVIEEGPEAMSQVVKPSILLPITRKFHAALTDIRREIDSEAGIAR